MAIIKVGDAAHYVLEDGKHRHAIVTEVNENGSVQLTVFLAYGDKFNFEGVVGFLFCFNVVEDRTGKNPPFTWHWPEND